MTAFNNLKSRLVKFNWLTKDFVDGFTDKGLQKDARKLVNQSLVREFQVPPYPPTKGSISSVTFTSRTNTWNKCNISCSPDKINSINCDCGNQSITSPCIHAVSAVLVSLIFKEYITRPPHWSPRYDSNSEHSKDIKNGAHVPWNARIDAYTKNRSYVLNMNLSKEEQGQLLEDEIVAEQAAIAASQEGPDGIPEKPQIEPPKKRYSVRNPPSSNDKKFLIVAALNRVPKPERAEWIVRHFTYDLLAEALIIPKIWKSISDDEFINFHVGIQDEMGEEVMDDFSLFREDERLKAAAKALHIKEKKQAEEVVAANHNATDEEEAAGEQSDAMDIDLPTEQPKTAPKKQQQQQQPKKNVEDSKANSPSPQSSSSTAKQTVAKQTGKQTGAASKASSSASGITPSAPSPAKLPTISKQSTAKQTAKAAASTDSKSSKSADGKVEKEATSKAGSSQKKEETKEEEEEESTTTRKQTRTSRKKN